jgi:hypothetical protein
LVHGLDFVRQSCRNHRTFIVRHLRGNCAGRRHRLHHGADRRCIRRCCTGALALDGIETAARREQLRSCQQVAHRRRIPLPAPRRLHAACVEGLCNLAQRPRPGSLNLPDGRKHRCRMALRSGRPQSNRYSACRAPASISAANARIEANKLSSWKAFAAIAIARTDR